MIALDQQQRERALAPDSSFIVQAPAGSGKTELLTRRYLSLLAQVDHPEEILAITFTRKAAAEMRLRILETLSAAQSLNRPPEDSFEREGYKLAMAANRRDEECGWALLNNPKRLRVQTIDSFCSSLVRQMPVLSQFGAVPEIAEDADMLYRQAADQMIDSILRDEQDSATAASLDTLLQFLDNKVSKLQNLIANMLQRRDQWLRHIPDTETFSKAREYLELVIQNVVEKELKALSALAPVQLQDESLRLIRYAQSNLRIKNDGDCNELLLDRETFPGTDFKHVAAWQGISDSFLTNADSLRKRLDKNAGFPSGAKGEPEMYGLDAAEMKSKKAAMAELLKAYEEYPEFIRQLIRIRKLPCSVYSDSQWALLEALTQILRSATAWLLLIFMEENIVDFVEVATRANLALGEDEEPTDLALNLDYRIKHMLVDEFQDTSLSQYNLFQKLTAGWNKDDGHSFFAVGDPMQSIYRFREAQVALFMKARTQGINEGLKLEPLTLSVNFRSRPEIIDWVNKTFKQIFPVADLPHHGAVKYSESQAARGRSENAFVRTRLLPGADRETEANEIAKLCCASIAQFPDETIAILLRTKLQAVPIIKALQDAGIAYSAVDIESLQERPVVRDILSLLQAILHPADRIHWLATLRAPWCGLLLEDIYRLLDGEPHAPVWYLLNDENRVAGMSEDGRQRLTRLKNVLAPAISDHSRGEDAFWLESLWHSLGGAACINTDVDFEAARVCFRVIRETAAHGNLLDYNRLKAQLNQLFAPPSSDAAVRVQLMTIHKSKGLEFPSVILPGLERKGRPEDKKLLNWMELAEDNRESNLLLAPIDEPGSKEPILGLVLDNEKIRTEYELLRLLYVGTTRARERLWLTACVSHSGERLSSPARGSLLKCLLPALEQEWSELQDQCLEKDADPLAVSQIPIAPPLQRLPADWKSTANQNSVFHRVQSPEEMVVDSDQLQFLWAGSHARNVGTVVHRQLQRISEEGLDRWTADRIRQNTKEYAVMLEALGVRQEDLEKIVQRVQKALIQTLSDQRGQWVLSQEHQAAQSEWALTAVQSNQLVDIVIDRTFVDDQDVRWIIDYKTGSHSGSGLEKFLEDEVIRYKPQLDRYAAILQAMEERPIKLGLYFPMHQAWREWNYH